MSWYLQEQQGTTLRPQTPSRLPQCLNRSGKRAADVPDAARWLGTGQELTGTFRSWRDKWGFVLAPGYFEGDLFCHIEAIDVGSIRNAGMDPANLGESLEGAQIRFQVGRGKGGRISCDKVFVEAVNPPAPPPTASPKSTADGRLLGTMRSWKGNWGFIICPEAFEGDLFCHGESLRTRDLRPHDVKTGMQVEFEVAVDSKGRSHATEVRRPGHLAATLPGAASAQLFGFNPEALDAYQSVDGPPGVLPAAFQALVGQRIEGTVRSWKDKWGFVISDAFTGDLFAHADYTFPGHIPVEGARVTFEVGVGMKGRPTAMQMQIAGAEVPIDATTPGVLAVEPSQGKADEGELALLVGQRLQGSVRSWRDVWGFLVSPMFKGDVFAHMENTQLNMPLCTGTQVTFELGVDKKGRHCGLAIEATSKPEDWVGQGECLGQIKSWRDQWGFIVSSSFIGDLFVHVDGLSASLKGTFITPGLYVTFAVEHDKQGRVTAKHVNRSTFDSRKNGIVSGLPMGCAGCGFFSGGCGGCCGCGGGCGGCCGGCGGCGGCGCGGGCGSCGFGGGSCCGGCGGCSCGGCGGCGGCGCFGGCGKGDWGGNGWDGGEGCGGSWDGGCRGGCGSCGGGSKRTWSLLDGTTLDMNGLQGYVGGILAGDSWGHKKQKF